MTGPKHAHRAPMGDLPAPHGSNQPGPDLDVRADGPTRVEPQAPPVPPYGHPDRGDQPCPTPAVIVIPDPPAIDTIRRAAEALKAGAILFHDGVVDGLADVLGKAADRALDTIAEWGGEPPPHDQAHLALAVAQAVLGEAAP